jgi:hypothetical protein
LKGYFFCHSLYISTGTHIVGYENEVTKLRPLEDLLEEINMHKEAGAEIMMIESEGITEDLPPEKWRIDEHRRFHEGEAEVLEGDMRQMFI